MKNLPQFTLLAAALGFSITAGAAHADTTPSTPDNSFTGKVALFSEYEYRGISQTSEKPAVQLNLDYAHKSGFYLGAFVSNISWLKDTAKENGFSSSSKIEVDIYGGFKTEVVKDVAVDVGFLHYEYPSSSAFSPKPNTDSSSARRSRRFSRSPPFRATSTRLPCTTRSLTSGPRPLARCCARFGNWSRAARSS